MTTASAYTAVIRQDGPWWIGWVEEVTEVVWRFRTAAIVNLWGGAPAVRPDPSEPVEEAAPGGCQRSVDQK